MTKPNGDTVTDDIDSRPLKHDGMLWKPRPGATATAKEFIAARQLVIALHEDGSWNPWVTEDRAQEYEAALAVTGQWTRAEPGFRRLTKAELDARMRKVDEECAAEAQEKERQRRERVPTFDEARHEARLRLLECDAQVRHAEAERAALASHERYPAMSDTRRAGEIAALDQRIDSLRATRDDLQQQVGDPETVVDQHGYLPNERREITLLHFRIWREQEVRELRRQVDDIDTKLAEKSRDRKERSGLRGELSKARYRLRELLALPRQSADDMCAECATPMIWHGYQVRGWLFETGPCPAWPDWAERIKQAREIICTAIKSRPASTVASAPQPQPIAVIPSGLPIADVMKRLAEIQAEHPDAEVRRGSRNKWEIWSPRSRDDTSNIPQRG